MATRYRRIEVRGPFEPTGSDALSARAVLETEDCIYMMTVIIPGTSNPDVSMGLKDETRQLVLGYLTLAELEKWLPEDIERGPANASGWRQIRLQFFADRPLDGWSKDAAESHAQRELEGYTIAHEDNVWQAQAMGYTPPTPHQARIKRAILAVHDYLQAEFPDHVVETLMASSYDTEHSVRSFVIRRDRERHLLHVSDETLDLDTEGVRGHLQSYRVAGALRQTRAGEALVVTTDGTRVEPIS